MKMKLGIDVDGVLADQVTPILKNAELNTFQLKYDDILEWDQTIGIDDQGKRIGLKKAIESSHLNRELVENMPVHKNAQQVVKKLSKDYEIHIKTARHGEGVQDSTKAWLEKHSIENDSLTHSEIKEGVDILIDDYPRNLFRFLNSKLKDGEQGVAILYAQPWNSDKTSWALDILELCNRDPDAPKLNVNFFIVNSWQEIDLLFKKVKLSRKFTSENKKANEKKDSGTALAIAFVGFLFAFVLGELAMKLSDVIRYAFNNEDYIINAQRLYSALPAISHLGLAFCTVIFSWIGWGAIIESIKRLRMIHTRRFLILITDLTILLLYVLLIRSADYTVIDSNFVAHSSSKSEAVIVGFIFLSYVFWDLLFKKELRDRGIEDYEAIHSVRCFLLTLPVIALTFLDEDSSKDPQFVLATNLSLLSIILLFRGIKERVLMKNDKYMPPLMHYYKIQKWITTSIVITRVFVPLGYLVLLLMLRYKF